MSFKDLGVNAALIKALVAVGIEKPFPIQKATLPDAIAGKDILGRGQTGSGKTLAFGLALMTQLAGRTAKPKASVFPEPVWPLPKISLPAIASGKVAF